MRKCECNGKASPAVRVVSGNDLTVEALLSVYDKDSGIYKPLDLSNASDVALRLVGTFGKVPGKDTVAAGSKVSAFFPAGSLGVGTYGVEVIFRDSVGRSRLYERGLIGVVETSGEATVVSSAEGDTGEGLNITVDVKTRTVRIGGSGSGVTDYSLLDNKPSVNGVTLEGNKTSEDLGLMPKDGAYSKEEVDEKLESLPSSYTKDEADVRFETKEHASGTYQTKEKASADLEAVTTALDGKVAKVDGKGLSTNDFTDEDKKKINSALQEYTETDPTVPAWAKAATKPTYTAKEVGALPDTTKIPSKVSELENDSKFITGQALDGYAKKTELPTKTSQLTNDSGFLTEHQSLEGYAKTAELAPVATSGKYEDLDGKPTVITSAEVQQMINAAVVSAINTEV